MSQVWSVDGQKLVYVYHYEGINGYTEGDTWEWDQKFLTDNHYYKNPPPTSGAASTPQT